MHTIRWLKDDSSIVVATYTGKWTWAEHFDTVRKVIQMLKTVPHRVDLIVDVSQSATPPLGPSISNISHGLRTHDAPNFGILVFAGARGFNKALLSMIPKVYHALAGTIVYADSIEDARDRIYQRRLEEETESDF